jgi:hypothetical protein
MAVVLLDQLIHAGGDSRTSARTVTPGQAMAIIPATIARMPSRINEVDVDLNMKGIPLPLGQRTTASPKASRCLSTPADAGTANVVQHLPVMDI